MAHHPTTSFMVQNTSGEFKFENSSPEFQRLSLAIDNSTLIEPYGSLGNGTPAAASQSQCVPSHSAAQQQQQQQQPQHSASMIVTSGAAAPMQPQHQYQKQQPSLQNREATVSAANGNGVSSSASLSSTSSPLQPLSATASAFSSGTAATNTFYVAAAAPPLYPNSSYQLPSQMYIPSATPADSGTGSIAQLWMGDIEPWMDDERISQIWARVGESVTVKTIRDRLTGGPANYCFLEFPTQAEAERILATYNGKPMPLTFDRPFRLNWASGVALGYGSPFMQLGLPPSSSLGSFQQQHGRSHPSDVDGAPFDNNGMQPAATAPPPPPPPPATNTVAATHSHQSSIDGPEYSLFVGDLASEVTDVQLAHEFRCRYPSVRAAKVVTDPITMLPRGYGFVRFGDEADQQRALAEMQGHHIGARAIRVSTATPKRSSSIISSAYHNSHGQQHGASSGREAAGSPTSSVSTADSNDTYNPATDPFNTTVFVGGLTHPVGEDELYAFFTVYGEVTYCKIPPNRGCGFVTFAKRANAEAAIRALNGHMLGGSRVRLSWGRSQSHARHNHRHHRYHNQAHRNSSCGGSSGVTSHRNSVSEQHTFANRRSVSFGKGSATNTVHGLGLSGASIAGVTPSTPASAPAVSSIASTQQGAAYSDAIDTKLAPPPGMHLAHLPTPVPGHANENNFGGAQIAQQQQQQQQQQQHPQPQHYMNGYNMASHSSLYMTSPPNLPHQQGTISAFNADAFGIENSANDTPFAHPFTGYSQPVYGYAQNQQQPEQAMLAAHTIAHVPGGLGDSPLLPTHFVRQPQQQQQGLALRNSGHFDSFYPIQENQHQQNDLTAIGSGTGLPGLVAASASPGDMLTRRLSALSLGNVALRSRPSSLVEGQPPALGMSSTFSFGSTGGIGGGLTPTSGNMLPPSQQQHQQQQAHPPLLDRRPSAGVIGQRRLSSKPSFPHQLQPQRSLSQLSMTQLWQPPTLASNNPSIKGTGVADLGGLEFPSAPHPADGAGSLHTPALSMRLSSSSLSLLALSPSMGGERSSGESVGNLPTVVPQKRQ